MASSSGTKQHFDVFVSFRGEDTRNGFTDHLFAALQRKGVVAFRDNQNINKGELLEPELFQAIQQSQVFIVVFSKNYASSTWCMKELTQILDCVKETDQRVLPIFYDVTPSEVRKQSGEFGRVFSELEERFKLDLDMLKEWRETLQAITSHCGWEVQNKPQHEEIEKIVEEVINILSHNQIFSFGDDLVDMHSRVKQLEELLDLDADGVVRVVGICGMGGIGKTTLATTLFRKISPQYDACCFIDDLSKIYTNNGVTSAQKQLLCQALNQGNMEIKNIPHGTMLVRTRLCHLKILVVLDNVDDVEQLEKLALHPKYLSAGSRIIIISRDSHILRNYGVDAVYNVQLLDKNHTLQLFCRKSFKSNHIVKEYYQELTHDILRYVNGLPLAIKVLGSFLFDRDVFEWRSALTRMKENPNENIMDVLRISFDKLDKMEKEIFLDIACFMSCHFGNIEEHDFLEYREFHPDIGLKVLYEKSLISYKYGKYGKIQMHDLLQELGKAIVKEKAPKDPRKWSRLWDYKNFENVLRENKEAKNLEVIVIYDFLYKHEKTTELRIDALSKMNHLMLLILEDESLSFSGTLDYLSNELRYLSWNKYPFTSLPSSFSSDKLVELILPYSNIKQLWKGIKYLPNLKTLDLSHSENLIEMPDLRGVPHLQWLNLDGCIKIVQMDPYVATLRELEYLNLKNCKSLFLNLDIIFGLSFVVYLVLSGCSKIIHNRFLPNLEKVDKNKSVIQLATSSVYEMLMLPFYFLSSGKHEKSFDSLVPYLSRLHCLRALDLSFCNLLRIPDAIGNLHSLHSLNLGGNKFVTLPTTIKELTNLFQLNLEHCKQLKYLPELPIRTEKTCFWGELILFNCPNLSEMEHFYHMVFSWIIQICKIHWQPSLDFNGLSIVIPGNEIPRWFSKQKMGSVISMDLSDVMDDPNWIGVACCAILVAHDDPTNSFGDRRKDDDYGSIGYSLENKRVYSLVPIHLNNDVVTTKLDHFLFLFVYREQFLRYGNEYEEEMQDLDKRAFSTKILHHPKGLHLMVEKCGYRWVFKEDFEQLNPDMMFRGNPTSRKHKPLTSD